MNNINLCAVATGSTMDELTQQISLAQQETNIVEIRMDYLKDQKSNNLVILKKIMKKDTIITCRRKDEGGKWNGNEKARLHILQQAFDLGFTYVDVELQTLEEGLFKIPLDTRSKTIVSFHNFVKTPSFDELKKISKKMQVFAAYVKKIAMMVKSETDIQTLYKILIEKNENEKYCVIGMGESGKQTRIISPLLGGYFTYCNINGMGSAPGQMTCSAMKEIYRLIH